ncbi:MinD/ParA family protein [Peptoanaerobacter stomatis]|uniref:MinD/ParA family protein n=1 Tax=Peptoanaerobacter stomatis TaxID=796937 RepID=UPI003F9EE58E
MINDQAQGLRDFVNNLQIEDLKIEGPKVLCVSSGKGGVGKSNFTTNIALELSKRGKRVIIIDADFGLANIEILFGIVSKNSFLDLINNELDIKDIMVEMDNGIKLISGGSGILELANVNDNKLNKVVNSIAQLKDMADYIIIDTGAGISNVVTAFTHISEEVIVVTTCEPTSVADAYALIKMIIKKNPKKTINIVVNRADTIREADAVFENINSVSKKFINKELRYLGYIYNDTAVSKAVKCQKAFVDFLPSSNAAKCIHSICDKMLDTQVSAGGFLKFMDKFKGLFR